MTEVAISVVVPSRDGAPRLPALFEAFRRQQTEIPWELLLVLDGPDDGSAAIAERYDDHPIKVISLDSQRGRPDALNVGFENASGVVLIRCDDDLSPRPDFIERHAAWHRSSTTRGVVGLTRNVFQPSRYATAYGIHMDELYRREAYARPAPARWVHWAANCSIHRVMWNRVGPYATDFAAYGEDAEWGRRFTAAGGEIVLDPALETDHLNPVLSTGERLARAFWAQEATARIERINGDQPLTGYVDGPKARLWSWLVGLGAGRSDAHDFRRLGDRLDSVLGYIPAPVGRRIVAWGVESAGVAGRRAAQIAPPR